MAAVATKNKSSDLTTDTTSYRPQMASNTKDSAPKIWENLLKSVSSTRQLAEKQLLVLGGTVESQREFLDSLSTESVQTRRQDRQKKAPVANLYALGYTYQDVLDTDQEDILARLSVYTLADPSFAYASLLKPLFTTKSIPNTLLVLLLDWSQPWNWIRQLRDWIHLLRSVIASLSDGCKHVLEDNIERWRSKKILSNNEGTASSGMTEEPSLPTGPGVWDEPLGLPLCVVAQNANHIEQLEKQQGWKVETFDFILQYLRTILVKHGASLMYTMPSNAGSLPTLIHISLDIQSTLQKTSLKHDVTNRDHVVIPPNWDSWGKIRVQTTEEFDVEKVSEMWTEEIQNLNLTPTSTDLNTTMETSNPPTAETDLTTESPVLNLYATHIKDPKAGYTTMPGTTPRTTSAIEVHTRPVQSFLAEQSEILKKLTAEDDRERAARDAKKAPSASASTSASTAQEARHMQVEDQIGPVQFNVGGIQVDVEDTLRGLKDREASRTGGNGGLTSAAAAGETRAGSPRPKTPPPSAGVEGRGKAAGGGGGESSMVGIADDNEKLFQFFAGLKTRGGSAANSPNAKR